MSQLIDHVFVVTGKEDALDEVLMKLENLKNMYPGASGIMEWGQFERTAGQVEFYLMDSRYFEAKDLTPKLIKWSESASIVIQHYSWTDDGQFGAWTVRIEDGETEEIAEWEWPHSSNTQIELLSLSESPTPENAAQVVKLISETIDLCSGYVPSGVGIAEVLLATFEEYPELLDDANVQAAIRDVEERDWSNEDVEDMSLDSIDDMEPLFQFYRLRASVVIHHATLLGVAGEIHTL